MNTNDYIELEKKVSAHNYHPIPVVIKEARGVWVYDVEGKKYLDMLAAYSAVNQGHAHPKIIEAAKKQMEKVTLTSRAFHNDQMGPFLEKLTKLLSYDKALLMNSGAEAVETAIKAMRRWGYAQKKIEEGKAEIIVCSSNFHGRTTTIVGFSTDDSSKKQYGPFPHGFKIVPYGDIDALKNAITKNTVGFLVEPIQGEAGVIIPPNGYLKACRDICDENNVLFTADEIQTGFGRTGKLLCVHHDDIRPNIVIIGKALSGGVYPVSAILADDCIMNSAFEPGSHGSTFGGNPLACAIASSAIDVLLEEKLIEKSEKLGEYFKSRIIEITSPLIKEVRGKGLMIGIELSKKAGRARIYTEKLMSLGLLAKETHETIIRFAPPLVIQKQEIDWAIEKIQKVLIP